MTDQQSAHDPAPEAGTAEADTQAQRIQPSTGSTGSTGSVSTRPISRVVPQEFRHAPDPMVSAERVCKSFGRRHALRDIDLDVAPGQVCCLIGGPGSGKTTFLRCVHHLEPLSRGRLWVDGSLMGYRQAGPNLHELDARQIAAQRRQIGMVSTRPGLFGARTVLRNVMEGPVRVGNTGKQAARADAGALLERFGVADLAQLYPAQISASAAMRVAFARALSMQPKVLLVDDPTANLDAAMLVDWLRELAAGGLTIVLATRDVEFARRAADTAAVLDYGWLLEAGRSRDVLTEPTQQRTRDVLAKLG